MDYQLIKIENDTFLSASSVTSLTGFASNTYIFSICDSDGKIVLSQSGQFAHLHNVLHNINCHFNSFNEKEELYVRAIDNMLKKVDYLQLTIQFDQELLTDTEFDEELEKNEDKYLIRMNQDFKDTSFSIVNDVLSKFKRKFASDEVSELFSIPIEQVNKYIDSFSK